MKNEPKVFRSLEEAEGNFGPCALAIGNFDGVHTGHQALIRATVAYAAEHGFVPSVLTFHPHPMAVLAPDRKPERLCSLDEKLRLLFSFGIRHILVLPFTEALSQLSPREFVWKILVNTLQTKAVFVGEDFRFGHKQAGNSQTLRTLGTEFGFVSQFVEPVAVRGQVVSSSVIRQYLCAGNVSRAARLLGRCFAVAGPVVSGRGIGSKQTVPTLNLRPIPGQVLPRGVFVTETLDLDAPRRWQSITNVGVRPTFGGEELTIETYLLSPLDGNPPQRIEVQFHHFVRQERQFANPEALKRQILNDVGRAQTYWRRLFRYTSSSDVSRP
jgi:riboflavin kinase / FMN adenylyltransferase